MYVLRIVSRVVTVSRRIALAYLRINSRILSLYQINYSVDCVVLFYNRIVIRQHAHLKEIKDLIICLLVASFELLLYGIMGFIFKSAVDASSMFA